MEEILRMSTFLFRRLATSFLRTIIRSSISASSLLVTFPDTRDFVEISKCQNGDFKIGTWEYLFYCRILTYVIKIVFLFKLPNIFREDSEVIGIVFFLRSIKSELVGHRGLAVNANVEKHRNNVKFHILKHITVTSRDLILREYWTLELNGLGKWASVYDFESCVDI